MHDYFFIIYSKNTFLDTEMTENMSNEIYYISWHETLKKCRNRSSSIKCQIWDQSFLLVINYTKVHD